VDEKEHKQRPKIVNEGIDKRRAAKKSAPGTIIRLRPSTSESVPDGSLKKTPVRVEYG